MAELVLITVRAMVRVGLNKEEIWTWCVRALVYRDVCMLVFV